MPLLYSSLSLKIESLHKCNLFIICTGPYHKTYVSFFNEFIYHWTSCLFLLKQSHIAQDSLKLTMKPRMTLNFWYPESSPQITGMHNCLIYAVLEIEPRTSYILDKYSSSWTTYPVNFMLYLNNHSIHTGTISNKHSTVKKNPS